jgi:hypothetical protein
VGKKTDISAGLASNLGQTYENQGYPKYGAAVEIETFHFEYPGSPKKQRSRQRQDHCTTP